MIKCLKERLQIEFEKQDRSGIYGFTQRYLAYNSNKIEGSTLTEKQTANLFETGTFVGEDGIFRAKDVEEMTGHFTLFNYMLQTYQQPLNEELIKEYHYKLKAGVFEDLSNGYPVGEYKNRKNIVSDIETVLPQDVPDKMNQLLHDYENSAETLEDIMRFHAAFEKIHPFQDGNGRVGRMLIFKECLRKNIMPLIIESDRKAEYYHFINEAQHEGRYEKLCKFAEEEQEEYQKQVKEFLEILKKGIKSPGRPCIRLNLDDQTLQLLYQNGESIASLPRKSHCSESTIRRHLGLRA